MQSNLRLLFAGKREAVEVQPKRGPGRPPKVRKKEDEAPDEVLEKLHSMPHAYDEQLRIGRKRKAADAAVRDLEEAAGKSLADLRMPCSFERSSAREGPQVKLQLCAWFDKTLEDLGGSDEMRKMVLSGIGDRWNVPVREVERILRKKAVWAQQCEDRGVNADGLKKDEAHLPRYLRKSKRCVGVVSRAKGGGRKDQLRFLYPLVRDHFEAMRQQGKYIDAVDLEENLQHHMQSYLDEAAKVGVAEAVEGSKMAKRIAHVRGELAKLRDKSTSKQTHEHRQGQLMGFCGARLRKPQRLTVMSVREERARWRTTLQAYDRLLWEAMRPEELQERVVDPQAFVDGIEDTFVIHADQVPMWLRMGAQKQLYGNDELRLKKSQVVAVPHLSEPGQQAMRIDESDGMAQTRQSGKGEGDRFRVTVECAQVVSNVFKPTEKPEVRHARPVLVVPGSHARLSNLSPEGLFIEDEIYMVKGKQKVRKANTSAGNLMLSWRKLRDEGDEEMKLFFNQIEVMQQPSAFCDGVIIAWIAEMRKKEGYDQLISVRDMFAGGLGASCKRMSAACGQLLTFIGGKMTPVMQVTDTAVAFSLKKHVEAVKAEVRREKRGLDEDAIWGDRKDTTCDSADLMRILGRSWARLKAADEIDEPDRLLKAMRSAGWLSYRADPARKALVRCDEEDWMKGREDELPERTHRHPNIWWEERYKWLDEEGEPRKPDFKTCGRNIKGLEYMRDEFPEQQPDETTRLGCLQGRKVVTLHCINLAEDDDDEAMTFPEVAKYLVPANFLKTQREKFEAARIRALTASTGDKGKRRRLGQKLTNKMRRAKMRRKLVRKKAKQSMTEFLAELRARSDEGYSMRQLIKSHIPDIGSEAKISEAAITAEMRKREKQVVPRDRGCRKLISY